MNYFIKGYKVNLWASKRESVNHTLQKKKKKKRIADWQTTGVSHIVLTTYDMITSSEFRVFSAIPRWEVLCVDEGQRRKAKMTIFWGVEFVLTQRLNFYQSNPIIVKYSTISKLSTLCTVYSSRARPWITTSVNYSICSISWIKIISKTWNLWSRNMQIWMRSKCKSCIRWLNHTSFEGSRPMFSICHQR